MKIPKSYLALSCFLLLLVSTPKSMSQNMRGFAIASLAPFWKGLLHITPSQYFDQSNELQKLQLQNQLLANENERLKKIIAQQKILEKRLRNFENLNLSSISERHKLILQESMRYQFSALPAEVIFRSANSWGSTLWINVGEENNRNLGFIAIAKNSPVILGNSIVGVIEYVGNKQSQVRLITDNRLHPAVRVMRTDETPSILYLAKGELAGSNSSMWRGAGKFLKGTGFNYDFPDEEGEAKPLQFTPPIIRKNDILVTTGLDGVFPPGFYVAVVTKVYPLNEGDTYFDIEGLPSAGNLDNLSTVFVIPPIDL